MKNRIFLALIFLLPLASCSWFEDATTVDINTTLEMDMPVVVAESTAMNLKSAAESYTFSKTATLSLENNDDLDKYLDKIKSITIESIDAQIFGLSGDKEIESLSISVLGVGTIIEVTDVINASTGVFQPEVSQTLLDQLGSKLKSDMEITVTVNGASNYAPMYFNLNLAMDAIVKAGAL